MTPSTDAWRAAVERRPSLASVLPEDVLPAVDLGLSLPKRKRALLVGIRTGFGAKYSELPGAHTDVEEMRKLLLEVYGYTEEEITIILDDGIEGHVQPTRANILAAIAKFVEDVKPGDHLFFHYCGHSTQVKNRTNSEEDGMDECLVPLDGEENKIVDNELHRVLVRPLPAGACLVAVLDTCHSGSLLDLKHYRCNRVFVPWRFRGKRNSEDIRNWIVRRDAALLEATSLPPTHTSVATAVSNGSRPLPQRRSKVFSVHSDASMMPSSSRASSPAPSFSASRVETAHVQTIAGAAAILNDVNAAPSRSASGDQIVRRRMSQLSMASDHEYERYESPTSSAPPSRTASRSPSPARSGSPRAPLARLHRTRSRTLSLSTTVHGKENAAQQLLSKSMWILEEDEGRRRCDSPVARFPCNGFCRGRADAWDEEDAVKADVISLASCRDSQLAYESNGKSMTSHLVDILRKDPNRTLQDVMLTISHAMYSMALERHTGSREYKRENKIYILDLTKRIMRLELKRRKASSSGASNAAAPPSGASSSWPTKCRKLASPLRKLSDGLLRMKSQLLKAQKQCCQTEYDMDNFQNPELSSPWPLDMSRTWPMQGHLTR